jgi:hypothetical protein
MFGRDVAEPAHVFIIQYLVKPLIVRYLDLIT